MKKVICVNLQKKKKTIQNLRLSQTEVQTIQVYCIA